MSPLYVSYVLYVAKVIGSDSEYQRQPRESFVASKSIRVPNWFIPNRVILNQSDKQYVLQVTICFLSTHRKKCSYKYESSNATKSLMKSRSVSNWRWDCVTWRLGQMLHRERREIAQGRHRGLVINLARVTPATLNCCTEWLASLSSTVSMYAPVTVAALDIQSVSQVSAPLSLCTHQFL